jgi:hypothetical protein
MKKLYITLGVVIFSGIFIVPTIASPINSRVTHQRFVSDTLITQLSQLNLLQYQGQPVDTLLSHLPSGYISLKIGGWHSQRKAEVLYVIYPNKISVGIHVRNFQYMNPHLIDAPDPKQNWNVLLFRKETITYTIVFNNTTCINGCENILK